MSKIKIMIINDSRSMRIFLENIIKSFSDCEMMASCIDGNNAMNCIEVKKPDVILLDLEMPHMDGLTFLELIADDKKVPSIVISNYGENDSDIIHDAMNLGAVDSLMPTPSMKDEDLKKFKNTLHHKIIKASLKSNKFSLMCVNRS